MKTLLIFITVLIIGCVYILFYHKIDTYNFLDVIHTGFIRQFVFELIPFIILWGVRDMKFLDITNTANFFNSLVGRSMLGMIGFTFVSYAVTTISPKKPVPLIPLADNTSENFSSKTKYGQNIISGNEKLLSYYLI